MTRETKIGLLVGLAFIIVIGVLLSDHLTSANDPKITSELAGAGAKAYGTLVPPGGANETNNVVIAQNNVTPADRVPTHVETARPTDPGTSTVAIGPSSGDPVSIIAQGQGAPVTRLPVIAEATPRDPLTIPVTPLAPPAGPVTPLTSSNNNTVSGLPVAPVMSNGITALPGPVAVADAGTAARRQHKAESGDTVSKMAYKYYGKNTKELRDLIVKANPSLQRSPDRIVVGQMYVIPPVPQPVRSENSMASSPAGRTLMAIGPTTAPTAPTALTAAAPRTGGTRLYTVKSNDSLWRIAIEECHDPKAVTAILSMNKDVLKGSNKLQTGMKLRLPEKKQA